MSCLSEVLSWSQLVHLCLFLAINSRPGLVLENSRRFQLSLLLFQLGVGLMVLPLGREVEVVGDCIVFDGE